MCVYMHIFPIIENIVAIDIQCAHTHAHTPKRIRTSAHTHTLHCPAIHIIISTNRSCAGPIKISQ